MKEDIKMKDRIYQVGIARQDVTPEAGIRLIGYAVREGVSHCVDEPLTLTVLAVKGQDTAVLIVGIDIALMDVKLADRFRDICARAAGIEAANVLVNFSHTHSGPSVGSFMDYDTEEQLELQRKFEESLFTRGAIACKDAMKSLQPARIGVGWGECRGNVNRRQADSDGNVLLGEDPNGECDRSVGVIRIDDLSGTPIAVAFRYSCHPVTIGPKTNVISPDFVGPARELIESNLNCLSVFLQGCGGNSNPASGIGQLPDYDPAFTQEKIRLGQMLGSEVVKVSQGIRTHVERAEPRLVQSVAVYWLYEYRPVPMGPEGSIRACEERLNLALTKFPSLSEVRRERADWAAKLAGAREENEWILNPLIRFDYWAQRRLQAAENDPNPLKVSFPIQVIEFGDLLMVALPFEPMMETGLELRNALGVDNVFVLGYSNGSVSYLPTSEISEEGGMEARLGYKGYLLQSEVPGDWEPTIKRQVFDMIQQ